MFIAALGGGLLTAPLTGKAQQADKVARVGWLGLYATGGDPRAREAFRQGLRELGYVEGKNLLLEYRHADGKLERFPSLATELVASKVDVIVTAGGTASALAAKEATTTIPVVFGAVGNPVDEGLVGSLARPGGNLTGLGVSSPEMTTKSLELIKQVIPGATRVALLLKPDSMPDHTRNERLKTWELAARALALKVQVVEVRGREDFDRAFAEMTKGRAQAVSVVPTPLFSSAIQPLVDLAARHRLPAIYAFRPWVEAGGLMSYGPDVPHLYRRAAGYVDKILKGAKPADLPVELPTQFELAINHKTAKALGLTIPLSLRQRADHVIE
jgi:putative ABC transport system substrate-binding protein